MKKRNILASIDVGTTKICTILADISDAAPRIVGVGISPSKGLHKGLVVNINEARESIRDSVRKAEQTSNYRVDALQIEDLFLSAFIGLVRRVRVRIDVAEVARHTFLHSEALDAGVEA